MKTILKIILLFICINSYGQKAAEIKISKNKIAEAKTIQDLISDIPKDCKIIGYVFSAGVNASLKEFKCTGGGMIPELKAVISYKEKGQWFFIESIKSNCEKSHKSSYKIIIE